MKLNLKVAELQELTGQFIDDEELTDWEWETDFKSLMLQRIWRLKNEKMPRWELYEELNEIILEAYTYFCGLDEAAQRRCAHEMRDVLKECLALKTKMREWARKEQARRAIF